MADTVTCSNCNRSVDPADAEVGNRTYEWICSACFHDSIPATDGPLVLTAADVLAGVLVELDDKLQWTFKNRQALPSVSRHRLQLIGIETGLLSAIEIVQAKLNEVEGR